MHKKIAPESPLGRLPIYPHCDARVLHAPGECKYCDLHPEWQQLRLTWGIAFTGYEPDGNELPDPATHARGLASVNKWGGNVACPE